MVHTEDKGQRRLFRGLGAAALAAFLTGCGGAGAWGTADDVPEERTVVYLDLADETQTAGQEGGMQETAEHLAANAGGGMEDDSGTGGSGSGGSLSGDAVVRKQPPGDFALVLDSEDWGLSFGESGAQPVGNASPEDLAWYDAYFMDDASEPVIYLTFDCGYENGNTEPILDALKKHHVRATFFVVGHFLETAPDLVRRMVEEGHAVGNHTYHHPDMSAISDLDAFQRELDDVADLFGEITSAELSPYYRPPQGKANAENIKMAQQLGYSTIFWSLAYVDWDTEKQPGHDEAFDKLTSRIHPGAVVLLHNTSRTNGEILDGLLTRWEDMGYRFAPLSELTAKNG